MGSLAPYLSAQVFMLNNFFDENEADLLIENALNIKEPANRLKRSTTGQGECMSSEDV
jgi:hypothetical protein